MSMNLPEKISGYSKKRSDFLIALLDVGVISEAAKRANITESTAHKWLNDGLNEELKKIRASLIKKHLDKLQLACGLAVDTLIEILMNKDKLYSINIRERASKTILENTLKIREQDQIIQRVENLEDRLFENGN